MSADRQRLTSAIRRIAKTDPEIRGLLKAADNKGGKPGAAGVGSSTDAESQRICCDGSTSGSANPGTDERDPDSSTQSGLDSTDPADLTSGDGTLSGVTDCATGKPICFDGAGFIPPDGWDDPVTPPPPELWQQGKYWLWTSGLDTQLGYDPVDVYKRLSPCGDAFTCTYDVISTGTLNGRDSATVRKVSTQISDPDNEFIDSIITMLYDCASDSFVEPYCSAEEYPEELLSTVDWPSDSCVNLAIINGTIVGSKYDPENDGSYSAPRTSIDLCSGTDQISLAPAANGGWKTINSTTNNGYLYDSSGKQVAHIDGNEYSDPSV